jgi:hypothetical protein
MTRAPAGIPACALVLGLALLSSCASDDRTRAVPASAAAPEEAGVIRLSPDPAFAGAEITVVAVDAARSLEGCRYEWRRNGRPIDGAVSVSLPPSSFTKSDEIEVRVFPPEGGEALTARVEVANSVPVVSRVTVLPAVDGTDVRFQATVESSDSDQDALQYSYRWFKNGTVLGSESGPQLRLSGLNRGDRIQAEVVASDGESQSPPARAEVIPLDNHPPRFTSQPETPRPGTSSFQYQAAATDEDRDRLRFELASGPSGMTVTPDGLVTWTYPAPSADRREFAVVLRVLDSNGGEGTQSFTLRLDGDTSRH